MGENPAKKFLDWLRTKPGEDLRKLLKHAVLTEIQAAGLAKGYYFTETQLKDALKGEPENDIQGSDWKVDQKSSK
jgi:hypothetical protein